VTCRDAREWLSDLLDDALEPDRRVEVEAHLASCAECRVELDRLRATVAALRGLDPVRAPAGFVDRVVQRAYPVPWYGRLGARLFLPLSIKLPLEAAAVVVIAGLAMLVWERTPELHRAARPESAMPSAPSTAPVEPTAQVASKMAAPPVATSQPAEPPRARSEARPRSSPATVVAEAPSPPRESVAAAPPAPEPKAETRLEARAEREARDEPALKPPPPTAQTAPAASAPAGQSDRGEIRPRSAAQTVRRLLAPAPSASEFAGRLIVRDRAVAAGAVASLLTMLGGQETGRREDDADTVLDVQIPEARYDDFIRGLDRLGLLTTSGRPNVLPLDPPQMRLTIRLGVRP
jgi:anti-sigma factor RsiW